MQFPDPNTTIKIHETMIQEELQRNYPAQHQYFQPDFPVRGPVTIIREVAARFLFTLGNRIAPASYRLPSPGVAATSSGHEVAC